MDISTQLNNVLCIKDVFIMERTDELFISTPLKNPFLLDNEILGIGFALDTKIMDYFKVDRLTADKYLQHCMKVFSNRDNINNYKKMENIKLLDACIGEINNYFYTKKHGHQSHTNDHSHKPYHVQTSTKKHVYKIEDDSDNDSDNELPPPTNHFGNWSQDGASAAGHA